MPSRIIMAGFHSYVKHDEFFPVDLLFLASTKADGVCYIETANLDGETNLKIRKALDKTWDYVTPDKVSEFKGHDELYENPFQQKYIREEAGQIDNHSFYCSFLHVSLGCNWKI